MFIKTSKMEKVTLFLKSLIYPLYNVRILTLTSLVLFLSSTNLFACAQYASIGPCPRIFGMPDFNISKYEGKWYEVEKYWFLFEMTTSCVSVIYLNKGDGTFAVDIDQYENFSQRRWNNPGITSYVSRDGSAEFILDLLITQSPLPFRFNYPYIVVDTDYTSYTIKYHCEQLGPFNLQTMWILSRNRTLPNETRKTVYEVLRKNGLDNTRLTASDQTSCPP